MCIENYTFGCGMPLSGRALSQDTVVPRLSTKGKIYQGGPREVHAFNLHTQKAEASGSLNSRIVCANRHCLQKSRHCKTLGSPFHSCPQLQTY